MSQDAQGKETTVHIDINGEKFVAHGLTVIAKNYLEVYIYEKWSDKEIANYESVKEFMPTSIELIQSETEPPQLLTEADLIALMDKHGIGTDATHADHIETVKNREYIGVQQNDKLVPGILGEFGFFFSLYIDRIQGNVKSKLAFFNYLVFKMRQSGLLY